LAAALDLLIRYSQADPSPFALPSNRYYHSLPGRLQEIREAAAGGSGPCLSWLEQHYSLIREVDDRRKVAHDEAIRAPLR
jgi:hypothetical protein